MNYQSLRINLSTNPHSQLGFQSYAVFLEVFICHILFVFTVGNIHSNGWISSSPCFQLHSREVCGCVTLKPEFRKEVSFLSPNESRNKNLIILDVAALLFFRESLFKAQGHYTEKTK